MYNPGHSLWHPGFVYIDPFYLQLIPFLKSCQSHMDRFQHRCPLQNPVLIKVMFSVIYTLQCNFNQRHYCCCYHLTNSNNDNDTGWNCKHIFGILYVPIWVGTRQNYSLQNLQTERDKSTPIAMLGLTIWPIHMIRMNSNKWKWFSTLLQFLVSILVYLKSLYSLQSGLQSYSIHWS